MTGILAIAIGGALGALARHGASTALTAAFGSRFPFGTLVVNVSGSFAMGWLYALFAERMHIPPEMRLLAMTGLLGAFTTFSTFSVETLALLQAGRLLAGIANVVLGVALCLAAAWLGILSGGLGSGPGAP